MPEGTQVRQMFSRIAPRYDLVNRVLSFGVDRRWRRRAVRSLRLAPGDRVLDVCSGTGDMALEIGRNGAVAVGSDFCPEMLARAADKQAAEPGGAARGARFLCADTMTLPFTDATFAAATVAFGIRNVADPVRGLAELRRVVRPGGVVVVLEFCQPRARLVRGSYLVYMKSILPRLGSLLSGDRDGAYSYLPASVLAFPEREDFLALMQEAGLERASYEALTLGVAAIYRAEVPRG